VELLEIGRIGRPHGLGGEVAVDLVTNRTERLDPGSKLVARLRSGREEMTLTVIRSKAHSGRYLVTFDGVVDRTGAERLTNATLLAEPSGGGGDLFVHELIGATVVEIGGTARGLVTAVESNPASDLLVLDDGALVPMRFVVEFADGVVTIDAPDGLFE
jgi:16S rRNA processing protein RimM